MKMFNKNKKLFIIDPNMGFKFFKKYYKSKYIYIGKNKVSSIAK